MLILWYFLTTGVNSKCPISTRCWEAKCYPDPCTMCLSHYEQGLGCRYACLFQTLICRLRRLTVGVGLVLSNEVSCSSKARHTETTLQCGGGVWHLLVFDPTVISDMYLSIYEFCWGRCGINISFSTVWWSQNLDFKAINDVKVDLQVRTDKQVPPCASYMS